MAAYPNIGLRYIVTHINPPQMDIAVSGRVRMLDLTTVSASRVDITHPLATAAERAQLESFWAANRALDVTITLGGIGYTLKFERGYSLRPVSATHTEMTVSLVGRRS